MTADCTWIITRIDGRIASVAPDYTGLMKIASVLSGARNGLSKERQKKAAARMVSEAETVTTEKVDTDTLMEISGRLRWEDLRLFGTEFQLKVWKQLFLLNHGESGPRLLSYSEFATICNNRPGIRAVAHAVGLNPVPVLLPCHRIIPKESIDRIAEIEAAARKTIFGGADIWLFDAIDFGEYALGAKLKRAILGKEFSYGIPKE